MLTGVHAPASRCYAVVVCLTYVRRHFVPPHFMSTRCVRLWCAIMIDIIVFTLNSSSYFIIPSGPKYVLHSVVWHHRTCVNLERGFCCTRFWVAQEKRKKFTEYTIYVVSAITSPFILFSKSPVTRCKFSSVN